MDVLRQLSTIFCTHFLLTISSCTAEAAALLLLIEFPDHGIVLSRLAADVVVLIRCHKIQQPDLRHHVPGLLQDAFQLPVPAPAGDCFGVVSGGLGNLCRAHDIGVGHQLFLKILPDQQLADDFIFNAGLHRGRGRFMVGIIPVPSAGRGVIPRLHLPAAQVLREVCFGDFVAAGLFAGMDAGNQTAF